MLSDMDCAGAVQNRSINTGGTSETTTRSAHPMIDVAPHE